MSAPHFLRADRLLRSALCAFMPFSFLPFRLRSPLSFRLSSLRVVFRFFSRLGVYVEFLSLAIGHPRIETSFPQAVVDLIDATRAILADFWRIRLEILVHVAFALALVFPWLRASVPPILRSILNEACALIVSVICE